jgi:para-aminobenzoate synthetase component 1
MTLQEFKTTINAWGQQKVPFLFWVDFELEKPQVHKLNEVDSKQILFKINGVTNVISPSAKKAIGLLKKYPIPFPEYKSKLSKVMYHLHYGDTFLTNLTVKTEIETSLTLHELFCASSAKYKFFIRDQFLIFSPETFVQIKNGKIYSNPMKGTIDASIPGAADIILRNKKEEAEHITIVDLIRNDLSMVSSNVRVERFRYLDEIRTNHKTLLQVSSEIVGDLPEDYRSRLGDILVTLLPAGSVSGAPKKKTLEIIAEAEQEKRGYYTGVVGYFDGENLDSGVMIRFIEQAGKKMYYRSGGGITTQSDAEIEYQEVMDKVYVPVD